MANVTIKISNNNLLAWSNMGDWVENGTSAAPTGHTLSGAGASVAREASTIKEGTYSAAVTRSGADTTLYHDIDNHSDYAGRKMTFGCWVYATVASRARLSISDGVGSTESSYHTGGSSWERLTVTHDVDASATRVRVEMQVNTGNTTAYFDGGLLVEGPDDIYIMTDNVDVGAWTPAKRYNSQQYEVSRREGIRIPNSYPQSETIRLEGMVVGTTPTTARTTYDAMIKAFSSNHIKPNGDREIKNLYLFDDRYISGFLNQITPKNKAALRVIDWDARFICPTPFFQAVNKTRSKTTLDASPKSATITNAGTTFSRPVMEIEAGGANITALTVENLTSDQKWSYSGTITAGQKLILDTDLLTLENNGSDDLANGSGEFQMILLPGANEFSVTITGGSTDSIFRVDWFDRYL